MGYVTKFPGLGPAWPEQVAAGTVSWWHVSGSAWNQDARKDTHFWMMVNGQKDQEFWKVNSFIKLYRHVYMNIVFLGYEP